MADYVLMVAEANSAGGTASQAIEQLSKLGDQPPLRYVQQAIISAEKMNFDRQDLDRLAALARLLQSPPAATVTP